MFRRTFTVILIMVSIGFGFLKQTKTIYSSKDAYRASHEDIGQVFREFRKNYTHSKDLPRAKEPVIVFICDRPASAAGRGCVEYFYDAQYAWAPFLVSSDTAAADIFLLDFPGEAELKRYCDEKKLSLLMHERGYGLAVPR